MYVKTEMSNETINRMLSTLKQMDATLKCHGRLWSQMDRRVNYDSLTEVLKKYGMVQYEHKVETIWYTYEHNEPKMTFSLVRNKIPGYNHYDVGTDYTNKALTEACVCDVLTWFEQETERVGEEIAENNKLQYTEELYAKILEIALASVPHNHTAYWAEGKRQCDGNCAPYKALVLYYKGNGGRLAAGQCGSIVFGKDNYGEFSMSIRKPLCGECSRNFTLNDMEKAIREEVAYACA